MTILGDFQALIQISDFLGAGNLDQGLTLLASQMWRDLKTGEIILPGEMAFRDEDERISLDGYQQPRYQNPTPEEIRAGMMEEVDDPGVADFGAAIHSVMRVDRVETKAGERWLLELQAVPEVGELISALTYQPDVRAWQVRCGAPLGQEEFGWISGPVHRTEGDVPQVQRDGSMSAPERDSVEITEEIQGLLDGLDEIRYSKGTEPEGFDLGSLAPAVSLYVWREKDAIPF
jgi:hypothetical protein